MASIPRYMGREGRTFCFSVGDADGIGGTGDNLVVCLAALGVSKTLSARLRAQGRAVLDASTRSLCIQASAEPPSPHVPARNRLSVLYEDDFVLAVDKPAGLLVHGDGVAGDTLTGHVEDYLAAGEGLLSPQAVQRLDVDTTGVTLFSKAVEFQGLFDALVADHTRMQKRYLALVEGAYPVQRDRIDAPLARDRHDARRMRACETGQGQVALTFVEKIATTPDRRFSLLLVTLGTGRKHQIRVHLASRGFPVAGDALYGAGPVARGPLMLHAWQEAFAHPVSGECLCITASSVERFVPYIPHIRELLCEVGPGEAVL